MTTKLPIKASVFFCTMGCKNRRTAETLSLGKILFKRSLTKQFKVFLPKIAIHNQNFSYSMTN